MFIAVVNVKFSLSKLKFQSSNGKYRSSTCKEVNPIEAGNCR